MVEERIFTIGVGTVELGYLPHVTETETSVHAESEVKLSAAPAYQLPDLHELGLGTVQLPTQTLSTSYFDTQDLRLWRRRITLRHRVGEGGQEGVWTLKLQGENGDNEVNRTELSWSGGSDAIPAEARRLVVGIVRQHTLKRIVSLESTRQRVLVRTAGAPVGEIDDDTVTVTDGGRTGHVFRQIEFEIDPEAGSTGRGSSLIEQVVGAIKGAGARIEHEQKFAKALGVVEPDPATLHADGAIDRVSTLGALIRWSLRNGLERLLDFDVALREDPENPPVRAVHQARVATRRLRSDLKTLGPVLDPLWLQHIRSELKWLGGVLGAVRDIDVLDARVQSDGAIHLTTPGFSELGARLASQRRTASWTLAEVLQSERYLDLLDRLDDSTSSPRFYVSLASGEGAGHGLGPLTPARTALPQLLRPHWKNLRKRVAKAASPPSDTELHRIRIGSKQLRYGAELAEPILGADAGRTARRAENIQTILGDHHDAVTAVDWLEHIPSDDTTTASFAAGALAAQALRQEAKARRHWEKAWKTLKKGSALGWLQ
jgi:CHAD domain-containing protein